MSGLKDFAISIAFAFAVAAIGPEAAQAAEGCAAKDPATSIQLPGGECFSFHASPNPRPGAPLVVFLHGDGGGNITSGYWEALTKTGDTLAASTGANFVVLVRPGYSGPGGKSNGTAKANDDDYSSANVKLAADAVSALKARFQSSRTIVGGTSGGAATAALIMGRHPGVADSAWLTACPCQVQPWRAWRMQSAGKTGIWSSLSPDDNVAGIAPGAHIVVVAGDKDQNTLMKFSEAYVSAARARGKDVQLVLAPGAMHGTVWHSAEASAALASLMR